MLRNVLYLGLSFLVLGCSTPKKSYQDVKQEVILDDRWSDTDNMKCAEDIIKQVMNSDILKEFNMKGEKPVIGINKVTNATDEVIDTNALINYIKNELINSRKVKFVANQDAARELLAKEMKYQHSGNVKAEDRKKIGNQTGLAYFLDGELSSKVESDGETKHINYQLNMQMINLENSEIEWSGMYRLRKEIKK